MKIVPAILTDSFLTAQQQIDQIKYSPLVEAVQIDIVDGQFVENTTVTPLDLTVADFEPTQIDFHLMTEEPMDFVYECEAVKDYLPIRRIYGQVERMSYQRDFIHAVMGNNWQAGLALDLFTPVDEIDEEVWPEIKHILLMGIEAGFQGKSFNKHVLEKIEFIRENFPVSHEITILVDGGVKLSNVQHIFQAGANEVAVGSALWQSVDPLQTLEEFYRLETEK
jgi:ribulose-phosphate 3-epimerase